MATQEQIQEAAGALVLEDTGLTLDRLNLIREVGVKDNEINLKVASTGLSQNRQKEVEDGLRAALGSEAPGSQIKVAFQEPKPAELNQVRDVVAVISGKGGVGKSLVSSLLAVSLNRLGYRTAVLDADLTGPTIPRMFGLDRRPEGTPEAILPVMSSTGIAIMSLNLLLPEQDEAVIWRGPVISGVIRQFWEGVLWGKEDFLIVDLPPGTADAPLTVLQQFPVSGVVIVFTPQALAAMIVRKTVKMAQKMDKPVLGLVENMSYLYLPEIHKQMEIFGPSKATEMSDVAHAPLLARLPIDPVLTKLCDDGQIENYRSELVEKLGKNLLQSIEKLGTREKTEARNPKSETSTNNQ